MNYPKQQDTIGSTLEVMVNGKQTSATIVRSDIADSQAYELTIYKTKEGIYLFKDEVKPEGFTLPIQAEELGMHVIVGRYMAKQTPPLAGIICRADAQHPFEELIWLHNGRILLAGECVYFPKILVQKIKEEDSAEKPIEYVSMLSGKLSKLTRSERARELHSVYKQLEPGKKGRTSSGFYASASENIGSSNEDVKLAAIELVSYVSSELGRNGLEHHAAKLRARYGLRN